MTGWAPARSAHPRGTLRLAWGLTLAVAASCVAEDPSDSPTSHTSAHTETSGDGHFDERD